jgi:hypothetical protein
LGFVPKEVQLRSLASTPPHTYPPLARELEPMMVFRLHGRTLTGNKITPRCCVQYGDSVRLSSIVNTEPKLLRINIFPIRHLPNFVCACDYWLCDRHIEGPILYFPETT